MSSGVHRSNGMTGNAVKPHPATLGATASSPAATTSRSGARVGAATAADGDAAASPPPSTLRGHATAPTVTPGQLLTKRTVQDEIAEVRADDEARRGGASIRGRPQLGLPLRQRRRENTSRCSPSARPPSPKHTPPSPHYFHVLFLCAFQRVTTRASLSAGAGSRASGRRWRGGSRL